MSKDWDLQLYYPHSTKAMFLQKHRFYVEQIKKRLLSQFSDLKGDADRYLAQTMHEMSARPSAGPGDDSHIPEIAYNASIDYYSHLSDLKKQVLLSSLAGMYHQWDKDFRDHLNKELSHYTDENKIEKYVWRPASIEVLEILTDFGWDVKTEPFFDAIGACHLIVNVYKHGKGPALKSLYAQYPQYLPDHINIGLLQGGEEFIDYQWLHVSDEDFEKFADAIHNFWQTMPERLFYKIPDLPEV